MDTLTPEQRSLRMASVRGSGNKSTELRLMGIFRAARITGWRRGSRIIGRPDFVFPRLRIAIFVDGCFWHRCPVHGRLPKSRQEFWDAKITANLLRDRQVNRALRAAKWKVVRVWEHELSVRHQKRLLRRLSRAGLAKA